MSYLQGVKDDVQELKAAVESLVEAKTGSSNVNTLRVEGAGSIWNGLALGVALGAVMMGGLWAVSYVQKAELRAQQAEAYYRAVYSLAPRFAEEIDKEVQKEKEKSK